MPPVSERQRRAMYAASEGKSTLGIPKSVGKEFVNADPGGKLAKASHPADSTRGIKASHGKMGDENGY